LWHRQRSGPPNSHAQVLGVRPAGPVGLGQLSRHTGKREEAREHLATATTLYREMDMRFWLEQAEAARESFE
jgi:hypothetical protein